MHSVILCSNSYLPHYLITFNDLRSECQPNCSCRAKNSNPHVALVSHHNFVSEYRYLPQSLCWKSSGRTDTRANTTLIGSGRTTTPPPGCTSEVTGAGLPPSVRGTLSLRYVLHQPFLCKVPLVFSSGFLCFSSCMHPSTARTTLMRFIIMP